MTITLTSEKNFRTDRDTVIDGGGLVTLDGRNQTRLLRFWSGDFKATRTQVTLQHLTFTRGIATGTAIAPAPAPCAQGFEIDGSGAAIFIGDGLLNVIDCTFVDNHAASPGPDVGGGAIYSFGSLGTTVVSSTFIGNSAANGGAIGSLQSQLTLVNNVFRDNRATGYGANVPEPSCPSRGPIFGEQVLGEAGSGGNGGAVYLDGEERRSLEILCNKFNNNSSGALGGALFRTPNATRETVRIDRSTFDSNRAADEFGGGALFTQNANLTITDSTLSNNAAGNGGAIQASDVNLAMTNVTLAGNYATHGLGGALFIEGSGGLLLNCTIANNHADGGLGYFGAAIVTDSNLTVRNTIFSNNLSTDPYNPMACTRTMVGSGNLQWPRNLPTGDPDLPCVSGIQFADARLGPLRDNGGPTLTMSPEASAEIIQSGLACPLLDQAGWLRRVPCTLGALER